MKAKECLQKLRTANMNEAAEALLFSCNVTFNLTTSWVPGWSCLLQCLSKKCSCSKTVWTCTLVFSKTF